MFLPSVDSFTDVSVDGLEVLHKPSNFKWGSALCSKLHSVGVHRMNFKLEFDDPIGNTNTWRTIFGITPVKFVASDNKWIGSRGGVGYISATGNKNNPSNPVFYGAPYGAGIL